MNTVCMFVVLNAASMNLLVVLPIGFCAPPGGTPEGHSVFALASVYFNLSGMLYVVV